MSPVVPGVLCSALGRTCRARPAAEELGLSHLSLLLFPHLEVTDSARCDGLTVLQV